MEKKQKSSNIKNDSCEINVDTIQYKDHQNCFAMTNV